MNVISLITIALLVIAATYVSAASKGRKVMEQAVGPCIADKCQPDHMCFYGQCVPNKAGAKMKIPTPSEAIGPCINNMCPKKSYCHKNQCYNEPKGLNEM